MLRSFEQTMWQQEQGLKTFEARIIDRASNSAYYTKVRAIDTVNAYSIALDYAQRMGCRLGIIKQVGLQ